MGLQPKIAKPQKFTFKTCACCGGTFGPESFAPVHSLFAPDGVIPYCDSCVNNFIAQAEDKWVIIDKLCQYMDIPFSPQEWDKMEKMAGENTFHKYAEVFADSRYDGIDWSTYYKKYREKVAAGTIEEDLPVLADDARRQYQERWGAYSDEDYQYLEQLYKGLINTQNVAGALQADQAVKLCKISLEMNKRIESGEDVDKLMSSYDKLIKAADFTPKNVKNVNDFESIGEVIKWMEKRGWKNNFYDGETRDIVDETIKSMQNFNQRLYTQEVSIGDEITRRIEALKAAKEIENDNYYGTGSVKLDDSYDNDGYTQLMKDESFEVEEDE